MNRTYFLLPIIVFLFICQTKIFGQKHTPISRAIPDGVEVLKDIAYVNYQNRELLLDIYRPSYSESEKLQTIIVIRGGGWAKGDKEGFSPMAAALALRGFVTICIEYRASDEAIFPAAVIDTKSAIRWVKLNAEVYNFKASSIGAIGGSAGAHLAALLGVSSTSNLLNPNSKQEEFRIQAVVGLATPTDFTSFSEVEPLIKWLGKPYVTNEDLWQSASPISYIDKDSPPMLLIHSSSDSLVPYEQSLLAVEKLGKVGVYSELILIPDAPHAFWNFEEWFDSTMDKAASFFKEQLKD
ncbi:pectinesterase [Flavobacteriaceae bacterium MAR_2010_72]|nr:pectinesterase [Flavobacteriaceae bacterium MAR_2010_72]TVZ59217.1 pectinesterase [Flavobacteriaceae bacterium MAR_2010_105]